MRKKTIQCGNAGSAQVLQHSEKINTHIGLAKIVCSDSQTKIALETIQNSSSIESQGTLEVLETNPVPVHNICVRSKKDDTTKEEIIWAVKTANDNYSFRSSDGIGDTFRVMFSNRPFYSCVLSYLAMNAREAGGDLALLQTSVLFSCKCKLVSIRTT